MKGNTQRTNETREIRKMEERPVWRRLSSHEYIRAIFALTDI